MKTTSSSTDDSEWQHYILEKQHKRCIIIKEERENKQKIKRQEKIRSSETRYDIQTTNLLMYGFVCIYVCKPAIAKNYILYVSTWIFLFLFQEQVRSYIIYALYHRILFCIIIISKPIIHLLTIVR